MTSTAAADIPPALFPEFLLGMPNPEVEPGGCMQASTWSYNRIARNGKGAVSGKKFHSSSTTLELLPEDYTVYAALRQGVNLADDTFDVIHASNDLGIHVSIYSYGLTYKDIAVYCEDPAAIDMCIHTVEEICDAAKPIEETPDDHVKTEFWRLTANGPTSTSRKLAVPEWKDIKGNYSKSTQTELAKLHALSGIQDSRSGNLIVLHGPAGTGKTTALRSLARAWKPWADAHYVIDPDNFLNFPDYLWQAVLTVSDITDSRWKLLIMEDVDELIKKGAKAQVGQAFSRLLNLADGFLGQGQRLIIVLTTNEPINELSAAITRPGRCLAHIEVPALSQLEASSWLSSNGGIGSNVTKEATLAELYEMQATEHQIVGLKASTRPGQYL